MQQISPSNTAQQSSYWLDILMLAILIGTFFSIFLGKFALFTPDGGRYAEIAREMVVNNNYLVPHLNGFLYFEKPPLFYWLTASAIHLFGISEWSVRFWPACFGVIGCLFTYIAGRKFYDRKTGLFAAIILATSLLYFLMGHLVTLDLAVAVLISITLILFLIGTTIPTGWRRQSTFLLAFAFAAGAVLTKGLIGIVFPIMIVGLWVLILNKWRDIKTWYILSGLFVFLLIAVPWHILLQLKHPSFLHFYFIDQQFLRYSTMAAERYDPPYYYLGIILAGFFPWSTFLCQAIKNSWPKWQNRKKQQIDVFLLLWIFTILIFFSLSNSKLIPYILPIFPPMAILTGRYITKVWQQKTIGITIGFVILLLCGAALGTFLLLLPHHYQALHPTSAHKFLLLLATILITTTTLSFLAYLRWQTKHALIILIVGMVLFLPTSIRAVHFVNKRSIKSLTTVINKSKRPGDIIVTYDCYCQDLPFYTRQLAIVVSWINELEFGMKHQNINKLVMTKPQVWQQWRNKKRIFMVIYASDYQKILKHHQKQNKIYLLGNTGYYILISNKGNEQ